jgi:hypothetical protein
LSQQIWWNKSKKGAAMEMTGKKEIRSYEFKKDLTGEWLVISDNKIVAHDKNLLKILKIADKYPDESTIVTKALSGQACFF